MRGQSARSRSLNGKMEKRGHQGQRAAWGAGLIWVVCSAPCLASGPLETLLACRDLKADATRLACFDRAAAALGGAPEVSAAVPQPPPSSPVTRAPALDPQQQFGLPESADATRQKNAVVIEARITGLSLAASGRTVFTLDNGQVWQQQDAEGIAVANLGDVATLSHGWLGSYWLKLKSGRAWKVTRAR
jgi:hypothetical protein